MLEKDTLVKVTNRVKGTVGYTIPDLGNLHRNFQANETKEVTMDELRKLSYLPGGEVILRDCLIINNDEAVQELLGTVEPEYNYTETQIRELLTTGTLDQFLDTLDFAPKGVIDLIKDLAVSTELNDVAKREALLKKTGFNVTKAIENNRYTQEEEAPQNIQRRSVPLKTDHEEAATGRRSEPVSKYKITSIIK